MTLGYRAKLFLACFGTAAASLLVLATLMSWREGDRQRGVIERRITTDAEVIAELLAAANLAGADALDREADRLGRYSEARVTFVAADGRVVGDSTQSGAALAGLENHRDRPEIIAARRDGRGVTRRYSTTVDTDMLYVAVRASAGPVAFVRLAVPLTEIDEQQRRIQRLALASLAASVPVSLIAAWLLSSTLSRRMQGIADAARRYARGDLTSPSRDYAGDELGSVARALDTSARELGRRIEELARNRALMEATLTGMMEGVLVVDRAGRLQLVNRAARSMLKVDDGAIGRPHVEVIRHPDISAQLAAALQGEEADGRELMLARDPGRTFIARAAPVAAEGGGGAVLVLHDITDLRRADQIRREFVANVSHELRTPLTAIKGYVEALLDEPPEQRQAEAFLAIVARHTARMERLVRDLLRLARLDARQEPLERAPCELAQLFNAVVGDLAPMVEGKRQRVTVEVTPESCAVEADPAKLHDIVRNLVENAINYSPDEAAIVVSARREGDSVVIQVADSGPGIPPEDLTRVFERFYRVDKSRTGPGTGLGLAIVKHLVELHGGEVRAANAAGGGAVFTVVLPAAADRTNPAS